MRLTTQDGRGWCTRVEEFVYRGEMQAARKRGFASLCRAAELEQPRRQMFLSWKVEKEEMLDVCNPHHSDIAIVGSFET